MSILQHVRHQEGNTETGPFSGECNDNEEEMAYLDTFDTRLPRSPPLLLWVGSLAGLIHGLLAAPKSF